MIVVTGATGVIGRALVDELLAGGAKVRALTRDPDRAGLPAEVQTVQAETGDGALSDGALPAGALFDGAEALWLNPAAAQGAAPDLIRAAAAAGVQRVVLLSAAPLAGTAADEENPILRWHAGIERAIRDSGMDWTFVRSTAFAANALMWVDQIRRGDTVYWPYAGAIGAPAHEKDIAAVAAAALLDGDGTHRGAVYVITGSEALDRTEQLATIGRAIGRDLRYQEIPPEAALEQMTSTGLSRDHAEGALKVTAAAVGRQPEISPDVERVTGRPALTFTQWVADHAADFAA
jgi:uncharacterized protein YbjT (DUF2867 family)